MATDTGLLPLRLNPEYEPEPVVTTLRKATKVFDALSSQTARATLTVLSEEPMPISEVAERVDTSRQNATCSTKRLHQAGLLQIVDTRYSVKRREMKD